MNAKGYGIYYLIDPTTNVVRYVGYSRSPEKRYESHLVCFKNDHKANWIDTLLSNKLLPILSIRCIVATKDEACRIEVALISSLRARGIDLTNILPGGQGGPTMLGRKGANSPLSGRKMSAEQKEKRKSFYTPERREEHGKAVRAGWAAREGRPTKKKGKPSGRRPSLGIKWKMTDEQRQRCKDSWTEERRRKHGLQVAARRAAEAK